MVPSLKCFNQSQKNFAARLFEFGFLIWTLLNLILAILNWTFFPDNINLYVVRIQRKYFYTQYEVKVQVFNDMCDHLQCSGPTSLPVTIYSAEDLPQVAPTQVGARPFNSTGILKSNIRFISYSKCSNWRWISKLLSNFGCLFTFCYLDGANSIKTDLLVCNLWTGQFVSYKSVI